MSDGAELGLAIVIVCVAVLLVLVVVAPPALQTLMQIVMGR